jgi:aspartate kinase
MIRRAADIVASDPKRRFVVPSAPGKRTKDDKKITDLLIVCHELAEEGLHFAEPIGMIRERFKGIAAELGIDCPVDDEIDIIEKRIAEGATLDYVASRGEYLNGLIVSALLEAELVDPVEVIFFDGEGRLDEARSFEALAGRLTGGGRYVIPGYYGADIHGNVKTFSRGGSDITGAVVAAAVKAEVYENWTDVSGLLMADPRVVSNPKPMPVVTYRELRELSYMGANVLHDEALFPVRRLGIPVNIRNTHEPEHPGTRIVADRPMDGPAVVGIAGKTGFTAITIEQAMMNKQRGFGRKVLETIEAHGISYEHTPTGIDTFSLVVGDDELNDRLDNVLADIRRILEPDNLEVNGGMALMAVVGQGMVHHVGVAARIFGALADAGVNIRMIDQGSSEMNIIVGVEASDYENAIRAIYEAVIK